jgi:hypothetical protein
VEGILDLRAERTALLSGRTAWAFAAGEFYPLETRSHRRLVLTSFFQCSVPTKIALTFGGMDAESPSRPAATRVDI